MALAGGTDTCSLGSKHLSLAFCFPMVLNAGLQVLCAHMTVTVLNIYILSRVRSENLLGKIMSIVVCFSSLMF